MKLAGTIDLHFGQTPQFDATLAADQLDLDALLAFPPGERQLPIPVLRELADTVVGPLRLPLPGRLGLDIDALTLGGSVVQDVHAATAYEAGDWALQSLELRAPGLTRVRGSGRLGSGVDGTVFKGRVAVESAEPKALISWLEAQQMSAEAWQGVFRANGDLTVGADHVAVDDLNAELDANTLTGKLDYHLAGPGPSRLGAELKAARLNLDEVKSFADAALGASNAKLPGDVALTLDIGVATLAGVDTKGIRAKLQLNADTLSLQQLAIDDANGAALKASGRIEHLKTAPRGSLALEIDASALEGTHPLLAKLSPEFANLIARDASPTFAPKSQSHADHGEWQVRRGGYLEQA